MHFSSILLLIIISYWLYFANREKRKGQLTKKISISDKAPEGGSFPILYRLIFYPKFYLNTHFIDSRNRPISESSRSCLIIIIRRSFGLH